MYEKIIRIKYVKMHDDISDFRIRYVYTYKDKYICVYVYKITKNKFSKCQITNNITKSYFLHLKNSIK